MKTEKIRKFRKIYIEISNVCNLKCSFCPQSSLARQEEFMQADFFRSLVKQLSGRVSLLCLHVMGEPLNHPRFAEFVDICAEENQPLSIVTNGILLSEENVQALLNPIVHQVNFSLQSFGDNFPKSDHGQYLERIFFFMDKVLESRADMHVNFRLWNAGHDLTTIAQNKSILIEIAKFLKMDAEALGHLALTGHRLKGNIFLNLSERFEWPELDGEDLGGRGTCPALKNQFAILADGKVVPCCFDKEGIIDLGSCRQSSLEEILAGPRATAMKTGFQQQKIVEDLCRRCSYRKRFDK